MATWVNPLGTGDVSLKYGLEERQ